MTKHSPQDKIPIFIPSKMAQVSENVDDDGFHVVFCKLYIYDCFQNKKCFFKGLGKVWIPPKDDDDDDDDDTLDRVFYRSPNRSPKDDGNLFQEPCLQQVNSIYGGQLKSRFSGLHNFNVTKDALEPFDQTEVNFDMTHSNPEHLISDVHINSDIMPIDTDDTQDWSLTQSLVSEENNNSFETCHDSFVDHMEVDNYLKGTDVEDDTRLLSLDALYDSTPTATNVSNKLDYEMLLPHSVVESNSYLTLQSDQTCQDHISDCTNPYTAYFDNCDDDHISLVNEEIDRKDHFGDYLYKDSTYDGEDEPYFLTDISDLTSATKKERPQHFKSSDVKCNICGRKCRSINALNHHMLVHSEDRPFVCDICKKAFKEQPTLRRHMCTHMDKQHQCDICEKYFVEKSSLRRHINTIHADFKPGSVTIQSNPKQQICCSKCGKIFKSLAKYTMHQNMHGNPNYECEICGKVYAGRSHLRIHQRIHTGEKPYVCNICNMKFAFKHVLKSHQARIHQKIHKFKCNLCSLSFIKKSDLSAHAGCHITNLKKNKRCYGSRKVLKKYNLQDFRKGAVQKNVAKFNFGVPTSPVNGLFGQLIDALPDRHDKSDNEEQDFDSSEDINELCRSPISTDQGKKNKECLECCKAFERMGDLKRHIISHIVENIIKKAREENHAVPIYECEICNNVIFKQVDKFKKHLREHAKLTLYQCDVCDRAFGDSSNFSKHKKVHGIAYLKCTICTRKFNTKRMMIRHMEYHRHNKPKTCSYCKKLFHFESNLRKHIKIAHLAKGKMTYKCEECGARFKSVKLKWEHQWEAHGMRKVDADCVECGAKFRKHSILRAHIFKEHSEASGSRFNC